VEGRFDRWRAAYATDPARSRGRLFVEAPSPTRSEFQRDRDRIIHSTAFRRLKHKTQVFVFHEGDHFRTRLTHTIEVAQIARSISRALGLDEDLAEALALSHDLGHPPFGHTGEDALAYCLRNDGGFDHNAQALKVVTALERRYPDFDGLNLSWETLEGLVKHNGPLTDAKGDALPHVKSRSVPQDILDFESVFPLAISDHAGLEAQVAALSDDIAYNTHDIDDGLRAGLFAIDELREVPFISVILNDIDRQWPKLETTRRIHELVRRVITRFVEGVIRASQETLKPYQSASVNDIRNAGITLIRFPEELIEADRAIKKFLFARMYRSPSVMKIRNDAEQVIRDLFDAYIDDISHLPKEWRQGLEGSNRLQTRRRIADYIAGMTDRFALDEHRRLFDVTPELR
jgi:dGTPase